LTADKIKQVVALVAVVVGIGAYYYLGDRSLLVRVLVLLAAGAVAATVFLQTAAGRAAWAFAKEARVELRKVVWPTRKETTQVTLVVIALVIVAAVFLWIVDWGLSLAVRALTG
jgi:preprotein translocase subunit SecE